MMPRVLNLGIFLLVFSCTVDAAELDAYGGYVDLHVEEYATGRFTLAQYEGRWWFWTPEGNAYFVAGVNKMATNWIQKSPTAWEETYQRDPWIWAAMQKEQLGEWGFNSLSYLSTIGRVETRNMWTDTRLYSRIRMPYAPVIFFVAHGDIRFALELDDMDYDAERYPDVWSPEWEEVADLRAEKIAGRVRTDPYVLGYFLGEEPDFQYLHRGGWIDHLIALNESSQGKIRWANYMAETYQTPSAFNDVYADSLGHTIGSFSDLLAVDELGLILEDAMGFMGEIAGRYAEVCAAKVRKYDPDHLILGPKFSAARDQVSRVVLEAFAPHVDAFSITDYADRIAVWGQVYNYLQKPIIISEFSYLGEDTGYHNAPYPEVANQAERGVRYRSRVSDLASREFIVGFYWHAYYDHGPAGEWRNWGLVDPLLDLPYEDMISFVESTNQRIFDIRTEQIPSNWWESRVPVMGPPPSLHD